MGDIADWLIDSIDYWDGYQDEWEPLEKTCKYCGEAGLYWFLTSEDKWRLVNEELELHECKKNEA